MLEIYCCKSDNAQNLAPLDPDFVQCFNKTIGSELRSTLKNAGSNNGCHNPTDNELIKKFWDIFWSQSTQRFFREMSLSPLNGNGEFLAQDLLLWLTFGHGAKWAGRSPVVPSIKDINPALLNWDQWIPHEKHMSCEHHMVVTIKAMVSGNYGNRSLDFSQNQQSFAYYGYSKTEYPQMKVTGSDCIQHITLHHTVLNVISSVKVLTDPNKKDSQGNLNRVSAHFVVSSSGIVYQLVDTKYAAWHAGGGKFYDHEEIYTDAQGGVAAKSPHAIPGNYNNCSIGIEIVDKPEYTKKYKAFTPQQEQAVANLNSFLVQNKMYGDKAHYEKMGQYHIVSHGEVDSQRKRDVNYLFDWSKLMPDMPIIKIAAKEPSTEARTKVLFSHSRKNPKSYPMVAALRQLLKAYGLNVAIAGNEAKDSIYDEALARCCWQFKAKYMGRSCPELCSKTPGIPYADDGSDMNLDWPLAAQQLLEEVLLYRFGFAQERTGTHTASTGLPVASSGH